MNIALAAFTPNGRALAGQVQAALPQASFKLFNKNEHTAGAWVACEFKTAEALIFIGATGLVVRLIAGLLVAKDKDPAVLVLDEKGRFVIPLLSGHIGGANRLAVKLATALGAQAVITTATDLNGLFAIDEWSAAAGCVIDNTKRIKAVSGALLAGQSVGFVSDFPLEGKLPAGFKYVYSEPALSLTPAAALDLAPAAALDLAPAAALSLAPAAALSLESNLLVNIEGIAPIEIITPQGFDFGSEQGFEARLLNLAPAFACEFEANLPVSCKAAIPAPQAGVCVSLNALKRPFPLTLNLLPRIAVLGAGCKKGIRPSSFEDFALKLLKDHNISVKSLRVLASIDLKRAEPCMLAFAAKYGLEFLAFSAEQLNEIKGEFAESDFVKAQTGVGNVCERAAVVAGGTNLLVRKSIRAGITLALGLPEWKCKF